MSKANQEEIICALWVIAALLAFGFGYRFWGLFFAAKAVMDLIATFYYGWIEVVARMKQKQAAIKDVADE